MGNGRYWEWLLGAVEMESVTAVSTASYSLQFGFGGCGRRRRLPVSGEAGGDRRLPRPHRRHNRSAQPPLEESKGGRWQCFSGEYKDCNFVIVNSFKRVRKPTTYPFLLGSPPNQPYISLELKNYDTLLS